MIQLTIAEIANSIQADIIGEAQAVITRLAPIHTAKAGELTFLIDAKYQDALANTQASAVLLPAKFAKQCPTTALVVKNPELCFAKIARLFQKKSKSLVGVHPSAVIGEQTKISESAYIGANCVIGEHVKIGNNTKIYPGTIIGDDTEIGDDCCFYSRVTIYSNVKIHNRVVIHSGTVIGADGFGYTNDQGRWHRIPQLGGVIIKDDVEIGANTCIDCGALANTLIAEGVKIDNQVQIGHNVEIGEHTIIAGCTGIAGSAKIGKHCMLGGSVNIGDHVTLADQVILTGSASVPRSIKTPGIYSSVLDAKPRAHWLKTLIRLSQLDNIALRLKKLEKMTHDRD